MAKFEAGVLPVSRTDYKIDASRIYTLAELIDIAETNNPAGRSAWQNAKARAAQLGVSESSLFPTVEAVALSATTRSAALFDDGFHRQTLGFYQPAMRLSYLLFDFGGRSASIREARAELIAADFAFNDVHRQIIYDASASYYRLLNAIGQEKAAEATLATAETVQKDAENRLDQGLATSPDVLETRAATAQADYDLQAAIGAREVAHGDLATVMGMPASTEFEVQDIAQLPIPDSLSETAQDAMQRALDQRPDLIAQAEQVKAADAVVQQARSKYFPNVSLTGLRGITRAYGQQSLLPSHYAEGDAWDVRLSVQWTLFDGFRREEALTSAKANREQAKSEVAKERDKISNEVWTAYSNAKTALRQKQAASELLISADQSYNAALRAYNLGVRNLLDVVSAQRTLAQARSADVTARTQVLTQLSNLAFRTGDFVRSSGRKAVP